MKKALSILTLTLLFSLGANAQTAKKAVKANETAKTEKASCCSSKKESATASVEKNRVELKQKLLVVLQKKLKLKKKINILYK